MSATATTAATVGLVRIALYVRVSTDEQCTERQIADLLAAVAKQYPEAIVCVYAEPAASGTSVKRPVRQQLIDDALAGRISCVMVTELSRWGRSLVDVIATLEQLLKRDVRFVCLNGLDVDIESPTGKLMLSIMAAFAEFERNLLAERTKSGIEHARSQGKQIGRPRCIDEAAIVAMRAEGKSMRAIASEAGVALNSVQSVLKRHAC